MFNSCKVFSNEANTSVYKIRGQYNMLFVCNWFHPSLTFYQFILPRKSVLFGLIDSLDRKIGEARLAFSHTIKLSCCCCCSQYFPAFQHYTYRLGEDRHCSSVTSWRTNLPKRVELMIVGSGCCFVNGKNVKCLRER